MLKKKIASVITSTVRECPKCNTHTPLSAKGITKCPKCGTALNTEEDFDAEHHK